MAKVPANNVMDKIKLHLISKTIVMAEMAKITVNVMKQGKKYT